MAQNGTFALRIQQRKIVANTNQQIHELNVIGDLEDGASSYAAGEQMEWIESKPGVQVKWLYRSPGDANRTGLFRLEPGARTAPHDHTDLEQIDVLSGSFHDGTRLLNAGDHGVRPPGAVHSAFSEAGAVALVVYTAV